MARVDVTLIGQTPSQVSATASPAALARSMLVPTPTVQTGSRATPAAVARAAAVPAPTCTANECRSVQATGSNISRIQDLAGATLEAQLQAAPVGNFVSFGAGSFTWSNFTTVFNGVRVGTGTTRKGIIGTGIGSTVLRMNVGSSTRAAEVPTAGGTTNQLYLLYFEQDGLLLECFDVQGTNQGHLYNGIRLHGVTGAQIRNIRMRGTSPGNNFVPPGETFALNDFSGGGNVYTNCEIDGREDGATGAGTGATAFGANSYNGMTYIDCRAKYNPFSGAWAIWQGIGTTWIINGDSHHNRTAFNIERVGREAALGAGNEAIVHIVNPKFGVIEGFGQDIFLGNDQGSADIHIYDPQWYTSGEGRDGGSGRGSVGEIRIFFPSLEQGNPNLQLQNDVHVWVGGAWSGGSPGAGTYVGGTDQRATIINYSPF